MGHTILRGGLVLDIAAGTAEPADILIEGDTIREIGPPGCPAPEGATEISTVRRLLHPGLVNAHTHGHGNLAKGMGDRWTLELLLAAAPWITGNRTSEDKYLSTQLGAVEMVLKGCTACYDLSFEWPLPTVEGLAQAAQAYADVGMRAVVAPDGRRPQLLRGDPRFARSVAAAAPGARRRASPAASRGHTLGDPRRAARLVARPRPGPPGGGADDPAPLLGCIHLGCMALARDFDVGLHSHVAELKVQAVTGVRLYGATQTAHLEALGVLGPHFTVAHGVWLDPDDMARLGDKGASVAHNPGSNMRLGSGLADARAMLERRVNLGIGTDGANCADNQNMYEAMRLASFVSKVQGPDWRRWLTTREAALAATEGSARALGFGDRIGRIAPGWKADIVMLDLDHPNWLPLNDPVNQLVHTEDGTAVVSVMIGGRLVVDNRRVATVDLDRLRTRVAAAHERLAAANVDNRRLYEALEPVVGSHCPGLARAPYHVHRYGARLE